MFCKEIKSNAVSKLFILVWRYEGMKVLDLGYENSYENFSITPICHIFSNFPAVFHQAQVMNRQVLKHGFTQLRRTAHISFKTFLVNCNTGGVTNRITWLIQFGFDNRILAFL